MKKIILALCLLFSAVLSAYAVKAYPQPIVVKQPDGTELTIRIHGDEFLHWTTCGNQLVAQDTDGYWRYASFDADGYVKIQKSARVARTASGNGSSVTPPASAVARAMAQRKAMTSTEYASASQAISNGEKHFLILLIQFSDKKFTVGKSNFENLLNGASYTYNGATGSVNRYYQDVSFGKFNPIFDIYGPITVSMTASQAVSNTLSAVKEACQYADNNFNIDFSAYCNANSTLIDNVFFFYPGFSQAEGGDSSTCIWPHAATYSSPKMYLDGVGLYKYGCTSEFKGKEGTTMAGIGTFCHEFGHVIGLPDFYDTDDDTNGEGSALLTLSLMSNGNYNNSGNTPPYLTYEEKHILGWDDGLILLSDGPNTLQKTSLNKAYYSPTPTEGEYYLYECRPCEKWDSYTGANGLAIYHIDKSTDRTLADGYTPKYHWEKGNRINAIADHQCMDLVESVYPESSWKYLDQLTFPGSDGVTSFTSSTSPAAVSWDGTPTGYDLTGITYNSTAGTVSFNVGRQFILSGDVTSQNGSPVSGATVIVNAAIQEQAAASSNSFEMRARRLEYSAQNADYCSTTDSNGHFEIVIRQAGKYSVVVSKNSFLPYIGEVNVAENVDFDITLYSIAEGSGITLKKYTGGGDYYSIGFGSGNSIYAGLRYSADELTQYVGSPIKSLTFGASQGGNEENVADKVGVKVFFDNTCVCDCECTDYEFDYYYTCDLSGYGLSIPAGKSVTFVYYVINPTYQYSVVYAYETPVEGANLINYRDSIATWQTIDTGNNLMYATLSNRNALFDIGGFNYIPHSSSYKSGDVFPLSLQESSSNPPASVSWTVNGEAASGSVTLSKGTTVVRAYVTYSSGRTETIETKLKVD